MNTPIRRSLSLGLAFATLFALPVSAETLLDLKFAEDTRRVDAKGLGSFHGVLPRNMSENYSGWSAAHVASEVGEDDGHRYLRLTTLAGEAGGQFAIGGIEPKFPGIFRLKVTARTWGTSPLRFDLRLHGAPYTWYWGDGFTSSHWRTREYLFSVKAPRTDGVGIYLYTGAGKVDLARVTLETATEDDLEEEVRRPPKTLRDFIRHARFPLGLPGGWNLGRDCLDAVATADAAEPAADGVPVLKVVSARPWSLSGEAFQTAYPEEPHTFLFSYRAETPVRATVINETGAAVAGWTVPASTLWRTERFVFRPPPRAKAFGVRFEGAKGPFRLDRVRVFVGEGEPPAADPCAVALAIAGGEIAGETRILFADEPAEVVCRALGADAQTTLRAKVADIYGRERAVDGVRDGGRFRFDLFPDAPLGQFRVTAWAERDGVRVSREEELVVTRLPRPVAWGRDAPDSPFGCHFNPNRVAIAEMKACGVNWARLHDAGHQVSGWHAQEAEKGRWTFHDEEVRLYRDAHVKIFAQLGTAPAWATHYGDLGYRHMGYFEKYLRPTNMVDWVNYVTTYVKRYARDIDEYFVWNEPWGRWWKSSADVKYFDKTRTGLDFAEFSRITYETVKRVNPKIRVSGFNSMAGTGGGKWSEEVLAGGGFEACDMIDWHYYTPHLRALRDDIDISKAPLAPIRAKHPDLGGKPVYMSEGQGTSTGSNGGIGQMSGLFRASVPWTPETVAEYTRLADGTVRYIVSLLAEGNAKVFLYTAHSYDGLARLPHFIVLLGADGFAYPSLVAHAQLAQAVEGRRFVRKEPFGANGVKYVFEGRGRAVALYSELTKGEALALAAKTPLADVYGNPVRAETYIPCTLVYEK